MLKLLDLPPLAPVTFFSSLTDYNYSAFLVLSSLLIQINGTYCFSINGPQTSLHIRITWEAFNKASLHSKPVKSECFEGASQTLVVFKDVLPLSQWFECTAKFETQCSKHSLWAMSFTPTVLAALRTSCVLRISTKISHKHLSQWHLKQNSPTSFLPLLKCPPPP